MSTEIKLVLTDLFGDQQRDLERLAIRRLYENASDECGRFLRVSSAAHEVKLRERTITLTSAHTAIKP